MTVSKYIDLKYYIIGLTYVRKQGTGFYLIDGYEVPESDFKIPSLPIFISGNEVDENCDGTKNFMYE